MMATSILRRSSGSSSGIGTGLSLGIAFLAICVWRIAGEVLFAIHDDKILNTLLYANGLGAHLTGQLVFYAGALVGLHILLGLVAVAFAHLTEYTAGPVARRSHLVVGWFCLLGLWVLLANAAWFPGTTFVSPHSWLRSEILGIMPADLVGMAILLATVAMMVVMLLRSARGYRLAPRYAVPAIALIALIAAFATSFTAFPSKAQPATNGRPNIILLGIDSLRPDVTTSPIGSLTPHIAEVLSDAHVFTDATTPLARTFPAWISILTGRHPVTTNTRFNLMPRSEMRPGDTLPGVLGSLGYQTAYATDEVRFANIDQSFGFEQTITPPVGAADFLLGKANDLPLPNVISMTRLGQWLFPHTYANRAAHVTYRPDAFVERIERELVPSGRPLFAAIHLTLAHWPYDWAAVDPWNSPRDLANRYRRSLRAVDSQFAQVFASLENKGLLDNAIVVILSDHGEAIGGDDDTLLHGSGAEDLVAVWGHGTSVLSPNQFQVMLGMRAYGNDEIRAGPARHDIPVTLEDLRPTLLDLVSGPAGAEVDGRSLKAWLTGSDSVADFADRVRFTETDVRTSSMVRGHFDEKGIIQEAAMYYTLDPESGRAQVKSDRIPELLSNKERAAIGRRYLLASLPARAAALPGQEGMRSRVLLVDRETPWQLEVLSRPEASGFPEGARLWDALRERFPGELEH